MSVEQDADVDKLLGQLESYANKGLTALESAKQEIAALEEKNQQLSSRIAQLETGLEVLDRQLEETLTNLKAVDLFNQVSSLKTRVEEALGEISPSVVDKVDAASQLDKFNPQQRLAYWIKTYPNAFMLNQPQPLKVGIHEDLLAVEGGDMKKIRRALASYVKVPRYLRSLKKDAERLDLQGNQVGKVTEEEAEFAAAHLLELERHKKQRIAQKKQKKAVEQERLATDRLQNKLSALVELNTRKPS